MKDINLIALSIPGFFLLIGVEWLAARFYRREVLRFHDAITDLACGIGSQMFQLPNKALLFGVYITLYDELAVFQMDANHWATWVGAFIGVDLFYYWWHRLSHRVNVMWAAHVVHHQSEDYNLAVALRQAWFTGFISWAFFLPMAVIGVPPLVYGVCVALNTLYQFWIHTRLVGKLGPLEWVMNTPSHHRVHHGINPAYVDKNHAGVFIVWDRMFGTFVEEQDEPDYGTVKPLKSWNAVWANFEPWAHLMRQARATETLGDKLRVFFMPPEWAPQDLGGPIEVPAVSDDRALYETTDSPALVKAYVLGQFLVATVSVVLLLVVEKSAHISVLTAGAGWVIWTTLTWGGLFERKRWTALVETARLVSTVPLSLWLFEGVASADVLTAAAVAYVALSGGLFLLALRSLRHASTADQGGIIAPAT